MSPETRNRPAQNRAESSTNNRTRHVDSIEDIDVAHAAEAGIIGLLLTVGNRNRAAEIVSAVPESSFDDPCHRWAYRAVGAALNDGAVPDPVTVADAALRHELMAPPALLGSPRAALCRFAADAPVAPAADYYAALVRGNHARRKVAAVGRMLTDRSQAGSIADLRALVARVAAEVDALLGGVDV